LRLQTRQNLVTRAEPLQPTTPMALTRVFLRWARRVATATKSISVLLQRNPASSERKPSDPHHLRFIQPRALGRKVSDEFTVPLCAIHHQQNHATANERLWWQEHKIDPLAVAEHLWRQGTRQALPGGDLSPADAE
jgi:hypothetical protein